MKPGEIVERLLELAEWGRLDYGEDERGNTLYYDRRDYNPAMGAGRGGSQVARYWITPAGGIVRVDEHRKWAQENVLKDPRIISVYPAMEARGYRRATLDNRVFYTNVDKLNEGQRAAVDQFCRDHHCRLEHLMIA